MLCKHEPSNGVSDFSSVLKFDKCRDYLSLAVVHSSQTFDEKFIEILDNEIQLKLEMCYACSPNGPILRQLSLNYCHKFTSNCFRVFKLSKLVLSKLFLSL